MRTKNDEPMTLQKRELLLEMWEDKVVEDEKTMKEFLDEISENGNRIVFQLFSDELSVYRSFSLNGEHPEIGKILDFLAGQFKRDLRAVYGYSAERWNITIAPYVK